VDLASLTVFRLVAREQSVTRAAAQLGRAASNVTVRVQQLEEELGVALFQRDRKRMELTEAGRTYLDYAERILNLADEAQQTVNPIGPSGTLRIGSMECAVASRLPGPLARFNSGWPDVTLDLSTAPTRQLIDGLLAHRIDCAFVALPSDDELRDSMELDIVPVFSEELLLLLPPGHAKVRDASDVAPPSLAAFAAGCTYRRLAEDWIADRRGAKALTYQEVRSYHAMFACTAAGTCFSVMPRSVVDLMPGLAVERQPLMTVDTFLASRRGFSTPAFTAFRDIVVTTN
jgi:DNA-binding transcriptional LysR family regulator